MEINIREIVEADIPALFEVRTVTHEIRLTREQLTALGITEANVQSRLRGSFRGWLWEVDDRVTGFAMGDPGSAGVHRPRDRIEIAENGRGLVIRIWMY